MAETLISNFNTRDKILCSGGEPFPGDLVRLTLDQVAIPDLPEFVDAVLQFPYQETTTLIGGCLVPVYIYDFIYDSEDVPGITINLTPGNILSVECVTCCQILHERVDAEIAARIADVNAEETARIAAVQAEATTRANADTAEATARATADTTETNARIAADTAEATARANADTAETNARIAADNTINTALATKPTIVTAPTNFTDGGANNQIAFDTNYFYWYRTSRWYRVAKDAGWV